MTALPKSCPWEAGRVWLERQLVCPPDVWPAGWTATQIQAARARGEAWLAVPADLRSGERDGWHDLPGGGSLLFESGKPVRVSEGRSTCDSAPLCDHPVLEQASTAYGAPLRLRGAWKRIRASGDAGEWTALLGPAECECAIPSRGVDRTPGPCRVCGKHHDPRGSATIPLYPCKYCKRKPVAYPGAVYCGAGCAARAGA